MQAPLICRSAIFPSQADAEILVQIPKGDGYLLWPIMQHTIDSSFRALGPSLNVIARSFLPENVSKLSDTCNGSTTPCRYSPTDQISGVASSKMGEPKNPKKGERAEQKRSPTANMPLPG